MRLYEGEALPITNQVIILGKRIESDSDGHAVLSVEAQQRADRFLTYYHKLSGIFYNDEAMVVCSGGSALLAHGEKLPEDAAAREGRITADYLIKQGVRHNIIEVEDRSSSTLTNFTNSMDLGYFKPEDFNAEHRLGVVTHPHHQKRAAYLAHLLGFSPDSLRPIVTKESDNALREFVLFNVNRAILTGASGPKELVAHEEKFQQFLGKLRGKKSPAK